MKKIIILLFFLPFIFVNLLGCWFIAGGAIGAAGAHAVGKDTIQGETDKPYDTLWNAVQIVSRIRGSIRQADYTKGYMELEVDKSQVWIRLVRLTRSTTRLKVSCRKHHLPNLGLAQDLFVKIMEQAK